MEKELNFYSHYLHFSHIKKQNGQMAIEIKELIHLINCLPTVLIIKLKDQALKNGPPKTPQTHKD